MGQGEKPTWFKQDKYKTVAAQAEAYVALESRFGSFTGAPKDGYKLNLPEGVAPEAVNQNSPIFTEFGKWAAQNQLSQEGYNQLVNFLVQDAAARAPRMSEIKARLGADADTRISNAVAWVKSNLGNEGVAAFEAATKGANADAVFKLAETLISKTSTVRMPKPGADVPAAQAGGGLEAIQKAYGERLPNGKLRINEEKGYRESLEKRLRDYYAAQETA